MYTKVSQSEGNSAWCFAFHVALFQGIARYHALPSVVTPKWVKKGSANVMTHVSLQNSTSKSAHLRQILLFLYANYIACYRCRE